MLQIQLTQEEKNLKLQLLHDDKIKTLTAFFEIAAKKYDHDYDLLIEANNFLNGPQACSFLTILQKKS